MLTSMEDKQVSMLFLKSMMWWCKAMLVRKWQRLPTLAAQARAQQSKHALPRCDAHASLSHFRPSHWSAFVIFCTHTSLSDRGLLGEAASCTLSPSACSFPAGSPAMVDQDVDAFQARPNSGGVHYINVECLEERARRKLSSVEHGKMAYDYYKSGAETESTVSDNRAAYARWRFLPRIMVDVSRVDTSCTLLGACGHRLTAVVSRPAVVLRVLACLLTSAHALVTGQRLAYPLLVAPMAMQCMAHPEGEAAVARAAGHAQVGHVRAHAPGNRPRVRSTQAADSCLRSP